MLGCTAADGIEPVCEFRNPEDMVAVPPGDWLLISQMAQAGGGPAGSIAAYQPGTGRIEVLFPVGEFEDVRDWGDAECAPPSIEQFAPHGIDIEQRADGAEELLVVNHGGRESVEYLRVERSDEGLALRWRGCVAAPDHAFFNDVVARRDGGFWATDMMPKNHQLWATLTGALFGADTGQVYRFSPREGFSVEVGSAMPFPNGIEKGQDENSLYVASFFGNEVRRLDLARHEVTGRTHIERPDNLTWSPDGKLLAAANTDSMSGDDAVSRIADRRVWCRVRSGFDRSANDGSIRDRSATAARRSAAFRWRCVSAMWCISVHLPATASRAGTS